MIFSFPDTEKYRYMINSVKQSYRDVLTQQRELLKHCFINTSISSAIQHEKSPYIRKILLKLAINVFKTHDLKPLPDSKFNNKMYGVIEGYICQTESKLDTKSSSNNKK